MLLLIFNVSYKLASAPFFVIGLKRLEEGNQAALKELNNANSKPALAFNSLQLQLSSNSDSDSVTCKHFTHWLKFKPEL